MYAIYEGFDIGIDTGTPVTDEYKPSARFTSKIEKVVIDLFGERHIVTSTKVRGHKSELLKWPRNYS